MPGKPPTLETWLQELPQAFAGGIPPVADAVTGMLPGNVNEKAEFAALLSGKTWDSLDAATVRRAEGCIPFLLPAAWQYYLPAFMRHVLLYYPEENGLAQDLIFSLIPDGPAHLADVYASSLSDMRESGLELPELPPVPPDDFGKRIQGLTLRQKRAVRDFLWLSAARFGDDFLLNGPADALQAYWERAGG